MMPRNNFVPLLALVVLLAVPTSIVHATASIRAITKFEDKSDILCKGKKLEKTESTSVLCQTLCAINDECEAYSFKSDDLDDITLAGTCILFKNCDKNFYKEDWVSGFKSVKQLNDYNLYHNIECKESDVGSDSGSTTWEECAADCDGHSECLAFSFRESDGRCDFYDSCQDREEEAGFITGVNKYHDHFDPNITDPECTDPPATCTAGQGEKCPKYKATQYESTDLEPETFTSPYEDIISGQTAFTPSNPEIENYPTCPFKPPNDPYPKKWARQCIKNLKRSGLAEDRYARPNPECPAGFFLCRGMCYTIVQRDSEGPQVGDDEEDSLEARCRICGGARVAFLGEEKAFKKVVAKVAEASESDDEAVWVRRFRFSEQASPVSPVSQPWHRFVTMATESPSMMTYQRYYTGDEDDLDKHQYDVNFRTDDASILCVNTIDRIAAAVRTINGGITMRDGCFGDRSDDMWEDDFHRWFPEDNWPYPGH